MSDTAQMQIKDTTSNPAPLGLFGFGMTTVLLNLHNAGAFPMNAMILSMGICYGGTAQVIAGLQEWKKNNTFGATAFTSYGFFWLSLVAINLIPLLNPLWKSDPKAMAAYLFIWGLFTLGLFLGTFRLSIALQVVFGTLVILFFLLAYKFYFQASESVEHFIGYEGIICGLSACYTGIAQVLNEIYGKTVLPLGMCKKQVE